jgi:hypothetical protein
MWGVPGSSAHLRIVRSLSIRAGALESPLDASRHPPSHFKQPLVTGRGRVAGRSCPVELPSFVTAVRWSAMWRRSSRSPVHWRPARPELACGGLLQSGLGQAPRRPCACKAEAGVRWQPHKKRSPSCKAFCSISRPKADGREADSVLRRNVRPLARPGGGAGSVMTAVCCQS